MSPSHEGSHERRENSTVARIYEMGELYVTTETVTEWRVVKCPCAAAMPRQWWC